MNLEAAQTPSYLLERRNVFLTGLAAVFLACEVYQA